MRPLAEKPPFTVVEAGTRVVKELCRSLRHILYNYRLPEAEDCRLDRYYAEWIHYEDEEAKAKTLKELARVYLALKNKAPKQYKVMEREDHVEVIDGHDRRVTYPDKKEAQKDVPLYEAGLEIVRHLAEIIREDLSGGEAEGRGG